jgi:hypothetical protein
MSGYYGVYIAEMSKKEGREGDAAVFPIVPPPDPKMNLV